MASVRVEVEPDLLRWAVDRSGRDAEAFARFPLAAWIEGERTPTLNQLEAFAAAARTPLGALLLPSPPETELPLTDFRTVADRPVRGPSAELIDVVFLAERRQEWMRRRRQEAQEETLTWIGSATPDDEVTAVASSIAAALSFGVEGRPVGPLLNTRAALVDSMEGRGVLVMIAGYVGSTHRRLDVEEFRGFCLVDDHAPLVFANGRDTKAGQLFTLLHEYAHLLTGESALDLPAPGRQRGSGVERWCNAVAAEVLVPAGHLRATFDRGNSLRDEVQRLHFVYRASGLVILSQLFDIGAISWDEYRQAAGQEREAALEAIAATSDGGNYYNTVPHMIGRRLLEAVANDVRSGRTTTTEAMSLLQVSSYSTFEQLTSGL